MVAMATPPKESMVKKLYPGRFPGMSPKMAAIVGYILEQRYTDPEITDMCITSDCCVMAQHEGDCGMNDFMGAESCLVSNWNQLMDAAGLTPEERTAAVAAYRARIKHW